MTKKRVTSFDVARLAGVSRSVVSAVLNGTQGIGVGAEKREAVMAAIRELNYHVDAQARGMKLGKSYCIATFGHTQRPMYLQLLTGVQLACAAHGYHVLLYNQDSQQQDRSGLTELFLQNKIDGVISLDDPSYANQDWEAAIMESGMPYVSVEGYESSTQIHSVLADYRQDVHDALVHLWENTHLPPIYLEVYSKGTRESAAEISRLTAYYDWCAAHGLEPLVIPCNHREEPTTIATLKEFLRNTAEPVFLANWSDGATSVYRAAWELDLKVGRDVWVMSADNTHQINKKIVPSLSVMEIPYKVMGEKAVEVLLQLIGTRPEEWKAENLRVPLNLVPGESTVLSKSIL